MNKLQRELETELAKMREAKSGLERKLDETETEHKKIVTNLKDMHEDALDKLKKEKVRIIWILFTFTPLFFLKGIWHLDH